MKRFFKYLGAVLAGALVLSSCVEEEKIVFNPEAGAAQVLGEIHGCTLEAEGPAIETTYAEVDFGVDVPVVYTLNIAASGAEEINTKLSATIAKGKISFAQKDLNAAILNMGGAADVEFAVDFQLAASMANDKGAAIKGDESYVKYSNVVTAKFVPYSTTVLDVDKYDHLWVIGAAESIGAWAHDKVYQYLYNYNGDGITYTGMIYYTDGASGGWKITGIAGWDDSCNWGSEDNLADEAEASALKLISSGGSQDIKCYSKPYYMWTFNKESFELKKEFGFTTIGIVGSFNDWNAADESCVMTYNAYYHRFYIDYEFAADGELKFAADGAWDLNFGEGMAINGGNIPIAAGKYRIYLDFNKNEYTFDANMYGKEEPGASPVAPGPEEPEPTPVVGWGLVGEYNSWGAEADVMLASDGTFLTAKGVALSGQVKFRKDGGWDVNFGAPGEVEPVEIAVNTELELVANGKNFTIAEGTYDVYLDEANAKAWFINDGSYPGGGVAPEASEWGIVGDVNGWAAPDITMYKTATEGLFVAYKAEMPDGGFKIRANGVWDDTANYGLAAAGAVEVDHAYDLICGGGSGNMTLTAGTYDIWFDLTNSKVYIMTPGKPISEAVGGEVVTPEPEVPEGARAINILCENPGWETANLYGWEAATSFDWPGIAYTGVATLGGAEYFYWTLDAANWGKTPGLIFNNGSVQTVDITGVTLDGDKCFRLTAADGNLGYEAIDCPVIKITYKNEAGWDTVSMYGWGDLGDFGGWPGVPMTKEGDVWVYELPVEHLGKSTSLIFNNAGAGAQTVDLGPFVLTEDLVFDNSNAAIK